MKTSLFSLLMLLLLLGACTNNASQETEADAEMTAEVTDSPYEVFGEAFDEAGAVPVQAVVAEPSQYVGQDVKIEGMVSEVCQMAGCWLTLQTGDGNNIRILVPRKEDGSYVFTVPKDISGRRVVVAGVLEQATLSEEEQHHLKEETAGDGDTEPTISSSEMRLTAQGVLLEKAQS